MKQSIIITLVLSFFLAGTALADNPNDYPENRRLWGPSSATFYQIPIGDSIVLVAGPQQNGQRLTLENYKTDQLDCHDVSSSYQGSQNNNQKWECTALATGNSNSEVFFRVGAERSNTIVIQVEDSKVSCCFPAGGGGYGCEQWTRNECVSRNGTAYNSCNECWEKYEREQEASKPKISCCFPAGGGGYGCEQWTQQECTSRNGTAYNSCTECWDRYEREQVVQPPQNTSSNLPPAGYEDEVLVNIEVYANPFPDTDINQFSGRAAAELYRRAVIGGFPDGEFKGSRSVNRAEAAKFLLLARFGTVEDTPNAGQFSDVLDGQWYTKYVVTAAQKGIINGHPDGTFRPANQVNKAEFLKMLALTFNLPLNLPHSYGDVTADDWFAPYVGIDQKYILFYDEKGNQLHPQKPLTREEVAMAIYKYLRDR